MKKSRIIMASVLMSGVVLLTSCAKENESQGSKEIPTQSSTVQSVPDVSTTQEPPVGVQENDDWSYEYNEELGGIIIRNCLCAPKSSDERIYDDSKEIVVPSEIDGYPVLEIGKKAFANIVCISLSLPDGLLYIDENAFEQAKITETLTIPETVKEISAHCFQSLICECVKLPPIEILNNQQIFQYARVNKIIISSSTRRIENLALMDCAGIKYIEFSEGLEELDWKALDYNGINSYNQQVDLPSTLKKLENFAEDTYIVVKNVITFKGVTYDFPNAGGSRSNEYKTLRQKLLDAIEANNQ